MVVLEQARRWPTQWYTFYDFWQRARAPKKRTPVESRLIQPVLVTALPRLA